MNQYACRNCDALRPSTTLRPHATRCPTSLDPSGAVAARGARGPGRERSYDETEQESANTDLQQPDHYSYTTVVMIWYMAIV